MKNQNAHEGFTFFKFLTSCLILGIVSLCAGLSFLANKSNEEAIDNIARINRAQIAYYLEYQKFAHNFQELQINQADKTHNYQYFTQVEKTLLICGGVSKQETVYNYAIAESGRFAIAYGGRLAIPRQPYIYNFWLKQKLKAYVSAIFIDCNSQKEAPLITIICENQKSGNLQPVKPIYQNGIPRCRGGTKEIDRY